MKIIRTASGKQTIKMSKNEWQAIGKKAGWMKEKVNDSMYDLLDAYEVRKNPMDLRIRDFDHMPQSDFENMKETTFDYLNQIKEIHPIYRKDGRSFYNAFYHTLQKSGLESYLENPASVNSLNRNVNNWRVLTTLYNETRNFMNTYREKIAARQRNEMQSRKQLNKEDLDQNDLKGIQERMRQRQETGKPVYAPGVTPPATPPATPPVTPI